MPPKKTRPQTKQTEVGFAEQVPRITMGDKDINSVELSALIRTIIREEINAAFSKLQPQLDAVKEEMKACCSKVADMEEAFNRMETRVAALEMANATLGKDNKDLKEKADRLENYSRKFNIRIIGLTPNAEKGNPTSYVSALFNDLCKDKLQRAPEVENAHRVGSAARSGQRVMIVRMHRLESREEILRVAKRDKVLEIRGMKLRFFPDMTTEMARARASFREVRNKLWSAGVKHGIIHPATLIMTFNGETKKFTNYLDAETFYKTVIEPEVKKQGH